MFKLIVLIVALWCAPARAVDHFAEANKAINSNATAIAGNAAAIDAMEAAPPTARPEHIWVDDMPGDTFDQQLRAAADALAIPYGTDYEWGVGGVIHLPSRRVESKTTFKWHRDIGQTPQWKDLFIGVTIEGHGCQIKWTGEPNKAMWEMWSPWYCKLNGPIRFHGGYTPGVIAIWHKTAWDHGMAASRCNVLDQVMVWGCESAYFCGGPMGADITHVDIRNMFTYKVNCPIKVQGNNLYDIVVRNSSLGGYKFCGVKVIGNGARYFKDNQVMDPWGTVWGQYDHSTRIWKDRIFRYGEENAYVGGGGPHIQVYDTTFGESAEPGVQTWAFHVINGHLFAQNCYTEHATSGFYLGESCPITTDGTTKYPTGVGANKITNCQSRARDAVDVYVKGGGLLLIEDCSFAGKIITDHGKLLDYRGIRFEGGIENEIRVPPGKFCRFGKRPTGNDGMINMGDVLNFKRADSFSFCCRYRYSQASQNAVSTILAKYDPGSHAGYRLGMQRYSPAGRPIRFYLGDDGDKHLYEDYPGVIDWKWHYMVVTYDGSSTVAGMKCYIDGEELTVEDSDDETLAGSMQTAHNFTLGNTPGSSGSFWGDMADVRVYDRVLSGDDIATWPEGYIARWMLNEGYGQVARDCSGNGYDGVLSGGVAFVTEPTQYNRD